MKRRKFVNYTGAASMLPFLPLGISPNHNAPSNDTLEVHVFSKHLQFLDYQEMGEMVKEMGFDGADLTVRPGGHVLPENVESDLPKAVNALTRVGLPPKMMTTAISNGSDPVNKTLLKTAAQYGIQFYRLGYFRYPSNVSMISALEELNKVTQEIALLNKSYKIYGSYQNHSGTNIVGASIWEIEKLLRQTELPYMGCQFDIRHAVVEGGLSWPTSFKLIHDRINSIALKDFIWEKVDGSWKPLNTPIGEGMVDFDSYFKLLKKHNINVPVSLHFEYDLGGAEHGKKTITINKDKLYQQMIKDLEKVRLLWKNA